MEGGKSEPTKEPAAVYWNPFQAAISQIMKSHKEFNYESYCNRSYNPIPAVSDSPWSRFHPTLKPNVFSFWDKLLGFSSKGGRLDSWVNQDEKAKSGLLSTDGKILSVDEKSDISPSSTPYRVHEENGKVKGITYWGYRMGYGSGQSGFSYITDLTYDIRFRKLLESCKNY